MTRPTHAPRVLAALFLVVAAACSSRDDEPDDAPSATGTDTSAVDESKPPLQPDGPLQGIWLASEPPADGAIADPRLVFTTDDVEVTAFVALGEDVPEGATLTVTWYRLTGVDGREPLFAHEIAVGPGGRAFSQGVAEGGLAPGLYETVATLDEHQVRVPWASRIGGARGVAAGEGEVELASLAQPIGDEDWNVPDAGDSGWGEPEQPVSEPGPGPCELVNLTSGFEPYLDVDGTVVWRGTCSSIELAATISGPPQTVASTTDIDPERPTSSLRGVVGVCSLPGARDFPGTVVEWSAAGSEGAAATGAYTLPDFGESVSAFVQSVPDEGSRVEPGDRIELRAFAVVPPPALGLEKLALDASGQPIDEVGNASGTSSPEPCDAGRFGAIARTAYDVPQDPPATIEICAVATTFDAYEDRACIRFFTGEVWTGTYSGTVTWECGPLGRVSRPLEGSYTITVGSDGEATMDGTNTASGSCVGPEGSLTTPITAPGRRTDSGFELDSFFGGGATIAIPTTGDTGRGAFTQVVPQGTGSDIIDLVFEVRCETCAE